MLICKDDIILNYNGEIVLVTDFVICCDEPHGVLYNVLTVKHINGQEETLINSFKYYCYGKIGRVKKWKKI